jgi:hypothetical protein
MPVVWALKIQNEANTFKTKCADPQLWPMPRRMSGPLLALREQLTRCCACPAEDKKE